jgi:non-homologous end joining protein Ku
MAPRAQWNGYLKLSLVSCPISLYPAISAAEKISFRQVNRETGNRLRQQLVDSVTGKIVDAQNLGRGYEVGENQYMVVQDEDLEAARREARTRPFTSAPAPGKRQAEAFEPADKPSLKLVGSRGRSQPIPQVEPEPPPVVTPRPIIENTHTIELDRFIPRDEIDPRYLLTPYYVAPRDQVGLEAFAVIREAMSKQDLVGMGRVVIANRERPVIVEPMGLGLRAFTLHYAHEVRPEADYFADIPQLDLPADVLEVSEMILNSKREHFDPGYLEDRYRSVLVEKLREKQARLPLKATTLTPAAQNVVNLMEALKASLAASKPPAPSKSRPREKALHETKATPKVPRRKHS